MSGQTIERLPDAELEVMQAIWDCEPPVSRADIEPLLESRHPMATTTLLTLLGRLTQKGVLQAQKRGKSKVSSQSCRTCIPIQGPCGSA